MVDSECYMFQSELEIIPQLGWPNTRSTWIDQLIDYNPLWSLTTSTTTTTIYQKMKRTLWKKILSSKLSQPLPLQPALLFLITHSDTTTKDHSMILLSLVLPGFVSSSVAILSAYAESLGYTNMYFGLSSLLSKTLGTDIQSSSHLRNNSPFSSTSV